MEKNKSATNLLTCGQVSPDIFESDDVKSMFSLSPNNKPIWRQHFRGKQNRLPVTISLYGACLKTFKCAGALGTDLNTLRVDGEILESGKKKLWIQKYLDTCGQGLSEICERYCINCSNVWLPSMSCLHPIRTCFSVARLRLDENDGTCMG